MKREIMYAHEHITIDLSGVKKDGDCRLNHKEQTIRELKALKDRGVSAIIDVTNRGMGRNTEYVSEVEKETGIHILQATGYYKEPFLPEEVYGLDAKEMAKILINEIVVGIEGSDTKAEVIGEIGTSLDKVEEMELKVFEAASRAHIETGKPMVTHITLGRLGLAQIDILKRFHVDLSKVTLSHIDLSGDLEYMIRLLDTGVNIAFDTIGKTKYQTDKDRAAWLKELCRRGYSSQILLSMDITRRSHLKENGGPGYCYLTDRFLPRLYEEEISDRDLENMLVHNLKNMYDLNCYVGGTL